MRLDGLAAASTGRSSEASSPRYPGSSSSRSRLVPKRAALALELLREGGDGGSIGRRETAALALEPVEQHVEVAQRARDPSESRELGADRLGPRGVDELAARAERRAQPPAGDAVLVEVLRVGPQAHARIVGE